MTTLLDRIPRDKTLLLLLAPVIAVVAVLGAVRMDDGSEAAARRSSAEAPASTTTTAAAAADAAAPAGDPAAAAATEEAAADDTFSASANADYSGSGSAERQAALGDDPTSAVLGASAESSAPSATPDAAAPDRAAAPASGRRRHHRAHHRAPDHLAPHHCAADDHDDGARSSGRGEREPHRRADPDLGRGGHRPRAGRGHPPPARPPGPDGSLMLVDSVPGDGPAALAVTRPDADTRRVALRTVGGLAVVLACYHTSLWSLIRGVTVDTPLAYLGLVPVIAAGLGYALARPPAGEPEIHDRHIDRIVGVPLVVAALVALILLPARMSTMYWLWRIDLLTMPLFVAGVVALLFGIRVLWRTKAAVLLLLLAWPIPFRFLVTVLLEHLADLTAMAVRGVVGVVPLAEAVAGDGISFRIPHGADGFQVQIASACSGANGLVGFLLVASAVAIAMTGSRWRKVAWVAVGSGLVLALNVARILLILGVGRFAGQSASIDVLHPTVGLVTFNAGVLVMVLNARRFGLELPGRSGPSRTRTILAAVPVASTAMAALAVTALVGGFFNHGLSAYDPIASSVGAPRIASFSKVATQPEGFFAEPVASIETGKRFFGEDSSWIRYSYAGFGLPGLRSDVPVLADVITTSNLQSFSDFGLEACYRFHGYSMTGADQVDLGNGVRGTVLSWQDPNTELKWTSLYWIWAVRQGSEVRYERVVLLLNDADGARVEAPPAGDDAASRFAIDADQMVRGGAGTGLSERQADLHNFLVVFGRNVIASAADRSAQLPRRPELGG